MALPTKEERIRRKKVMQSAGINVPNTDESWGPWWDEQWKKAITHTKTSDYYGVPSVWNFMREIGNNATGNTTYEVEPQPIGGTLQATDNSVGAQIKRTLNNWQHSGDPVRDITMLLMPDPSKPIKVGKAVVKAVPQLVKLVPKLFTKEGAKAAGAKAAEAVVREVPRTSVGFAGGYGVDKISEAATGKTWTENASDKMSDMAGFHIEPVFGEVTNPGYISGYKWMDRGIRRAAFNHITPVSYTDKVRNIKLPMSKTEEFEAVIGNVPKQLISFKPIKVPAWRTRLERMSEYNPNTNNIFQMPISDLDFINNREEAVRIVFGQPQKTPLYIKNNNGTYSYNLDHVASQKSTLPNLVKDEYNVSPSGKVSTRYTYKPYGEYFYKDNFGYGDNLGYNGGYINYKEKDGVSYISDIFDVHPFKDSYRTANIFNLGKFMHKYLPNFEAFSALGGKPFKLEMTLPTYVDPYSSFTL